ncbi:MAG: hypothetical protein GXX82_07595 [Syntrophorhabdus sp.]|nr:hypothetical protein [Syntrophorhabdus sp.]
MARRSRTAVSCCAALFVLVWGSTSPVMGQVQEGPQGSVPDAGRFSLTRVLSRQIAFVRSFSVEYPSQFRQGSRAAAPGKPAAGDGKARGE